MQLLAHLKQKWKSVDLTPSSSQEETMIQPHGGKLVERALKGQTKDDVLARAGNLRGLAVDSELVSDVENIATGVYSPLEGFMGPGDFRSVLNGMRLQNDLPWTIPIVLDTDRETAGGLNAGEEILLRAEDEIGRAHV
jgi:sulfate adenylyltransferase